MLHCVETHFNCIVLFVYVLFVYLFFTMMSSRCAAFACRNHKTRECVPKDFIQELRQPGMGSVLFITVKLPFPSALVFS